MKGTDTPRPGAYRVLEEILAFSGNPLKTRDKIQSAQLSRLIWFTTGVLLYAVKFERAGMVDNASGYEWATKSWRA